MLNPINKLRAAFGVVCLWMFCLNPHFSGAQEIPIFRVNAGNSDSTLISYPLKKGNYYFISGGLYLAPTDTVVYLTDTANLLMSRHMYKFDTVFNERIKTSSQRNIITKALYQRLIPDKPPLAGTSVQGVNEFEPFAGKTIASVEIIPLPVFGSDVYDTTLQLLSASKKMYNSVHVNTRQSKMKRLLLFQEGHTVNPFVVADGERIIRGLDAVSDAHIRIIPDLFDSSLVHVQVLTQDAFPVSLGGQMYDYDRGRLDITHDNLLGLGHQLVNHFYTDATGNEKGYHGIYLMENLYKTFINARFDFYHVNTNQHSGFTAYRNFISPEIKYAGALRFYSTRTPVAASDSLWQVWYREQDFWMGRNFQLPISRNGYRPSVTVSGRFYAVQFMEKPDSVFNSNYQMASSKQWFGKVGYWHQKFYKNNMVYSSGLVEDIPDGFLWDCTGGIQQLTGLTRGYVSTQIAFGKISHRNGYVYLKAAAGTWFTGNKTESSVFVTDLKGFSPIVKTGGPFLRQFGSIHWVHTSAKETLNPLRLSSGNGLRGYTADEPTGKNRLVFSTETVIFPRWNLLGYGSTFFTFYDVGVMGNSVKELWNQKMYSGLGIGFRFRNNRSLIKSVELRLTWFPVVPKGAHWNVYASSEQTLSIDNLTPVLPETITVE